MRRPRTPLVLAAAAGLLLAACSDEPDSSPTAPMVARPGTAALSACNARAFRDARGFARDYFVQPSEGTAVDLVDAMEEAVGSTRTARALDLFQLVAQGTDATENTAAGSSLLNIVAACGELGLTADLDWTGALGPQGALAVVGDGSANESDPVYAKDRFSAVAPPTTKDWSAWLRLPDANFPDPRAVVFGAPFNVNTTLSPEPEIGSRGFDWNVLPPRQFPFGLDANDDGFFGICVDSPGTARIQNNHSSTIQGILGAYDPATAPLLLTCDGFTGDGQPPTLGLLRRALNLLSPQPAYAVALGKRTGGTPGGFSKHFVVGPSALRVSVETIRDARVGDILNAPGGVKVHVVTVLPNGQDGVPVQLVEVTIEVSGNSGQPAEFTGTKAARTNEFGVATFPDLQLFSAGGYTLRAFTTAGLSGLDAVQGFSNAFHIKNRRR